MIACDSLFFLGDFVHGLDFIYLLFALSAVRVVSLLRFCPQTDAEFFFFFLLHIIGWMVKGGSKKKRKKILGPRLKEKEDFFFVYIYIFIFRVAPPLPKSLDHLYFN